MTRLFVATGLVALTTIAYAIHIAEVSNAANGLIIPWVASLIWATHEMYKEDQDQRKMK